MVDPIVTPIIYVLVIISLNTAPVAINYIRSLNRNQYVRQVSRYDNPELFNLLLSYLFTMQHQIRNGTVVTTFRHGSKTFVFKLPSLNTRWHIKTKYTDMTFRMTSLNACEIGSSKQHNKCLDYFIKQLCQQGGLVPPNDVMSAERPAVVHTDPICAPVYTKEYQEELQLCKSIANPSPSPIPKSGRRRRTPTKMKLSIVKND